MPRRKGSILNVLLGFPARLLNQAGFAGEMTDEEKEELRGKAGEAILLNGDTPQVKKFLQACALNVALMNCDGDRSGMEFIIKGKTFVFKSA